MENKNYGLWGGVTIGVLIIVLGVMWFVGGTSTPTPGGSIVMPEVTAGDWQEDSSNPLGTGTSTLPLTLVEYSDLQCPACKAYYPIVERLKTEYATSTRFVYRHFPLPQHLDAKMGAYAAEAAGKQGKFFEMHDMLFEKQSEWGIDTSVLPTDPKELTPAMQAVLEPKLIAYAQSLGLDVTKFKTDMASKEVHDKIEAAIAEGKQIKIPATPTFFLNGKQIVNPNGFDPFKTLMDDTLKKS